MDVKGFYQKLRKIEAEITDPFVIVKSKETPDGGHAGVLTEVSRRLGAQMITEGKAELASPEEVAGYRERVAQAQKAAEQRAVAKRLHVTVVTDGESIKSASVQKNAKA